MPKTPKEIKLLLVERDKTIAGMARKFSELLGRHVWPEIVSRTLHGKPGYEQPELRRLIAEELGLSVEDLPRYVAPAVKGAEPQPAAA